ncbi:DNA-directed DNA polymerase eta rad30 [Tulasnella sp. 417]|nr:DNA-directed DNA polymerase eta rad30 [Tulasnella sp. 417]
MDRISSKGKEKASEHDDLNPVITYRHLLTNKMGVLDPLRVVALCDLDAFYAAAEQVRLNIDPELPLAVQQWQGLIAVNYPARKFGITRMETVTEAKKKCPELILVHVATFKEGESEPGYWENPDVNTHKVSLDHYRRESMKILNLHRECMDPSVEVEKASIDEAFFDFTVPVKKAILDRFPHLGSPPPDSPLGLDTPLPPPPDISWEGLGNLVPINPKNPDEKEEPPAPDASTSAQPADPEETDDNHVITWQDVALSIGAEFMMKSRMEVKNRLGYTTSAGIARNKMLAKARMPQPRLLSMADNSRSSLHPLKSATSSLFCGTLPFLGSFAICPFRRFLGGKLGEALADEFGAKTVGDVLTVSLEDMQRKFGEESIWVYNILRGIDHTEVKEKVATKSMLASKNVRPNITKPVEVTHWLRVLASELCVRLIEARERTPAIWPKTLVLGFRQAFGATKSKQTPFPFAKLITPELVLKPAEKLFKELSGNAAYKISNISLGFHGLEMMEAGQQGIEGFFAGSSKASAARAVSTAPEEAQDMALGKRKREEGAAEMIVSDEGEQDNGRDRVASRPPPEPLPTAGSSSSSTSLESLSSFHCDRCRKVISLSKRAIALRSEDKAQALSKLQAEHADFHVAQDLAREVIDISSDDEDQRKKPKQKAIGKPKSKPENKKGTAGKVKKPPEGIAKFFTNAAKR